ncbi:hypothetical protein V2G26_019996 [Clonostachys chloroleuca]
MNRAYGLQLFEAKEYITNTHIFYLTQFAAMPRITTFYLCIGRKRLLDDHLQFYNTHTYKKAERHVSNNLGWEGTSY